MSAQLTLRPDLGEVWQDLRRKLRAVVDAVGLKVAAPELDVSPSLLLHSLDERQNHHCRASWLPYLVTRAPSDEIVAYLASLRGLEVREPDPLTPEQELHALRETVAELLGPELRDAVMRKAARRAARR